MDTYSDHPTEFDDAALEVAPAQSQVADAIGSDERRMHVRAYNYWCSLLDGRDFPSIHNLQASEIEDFSSNSVLLNFAGAANNPQTAFVGEAIRAEIGVDTIERISDVPGRSLLSRLTDHHFQIIATRAPVGFEADFINQRGHEISYRGILMPFSSDGQEIDYVYGVINWKDNGPASNAQAPLRAALPPLVAEREDEQEILDLLAAEERAHVERDHLRSEALASLAAPHLVWEDGPSSEPAADDDELELVAPLGADGMIMGQSTIGGGLVQEMTLFSPGPSIYGGTDQVQRNIIGERVLGLPKEPRADRAKA